MRYFHKHNGLPMGFLIDILVSSPDKREMNFSYVLFQALRFENDHSLFDILPFTIVYPHFLGNSRSSEIPSSSWTSSFLFSVEKPSCKAYVWSRPWPTLLPD